AQLAGKIGENITPRRFVRIAAQGKLSSYIHGGKIGVLVDLVGGDDELGRDIAMHIAAAKPKALNADGVDVALIETERRVAIEKALEAGKPEAMVEKIAEGTVNKYLKEVTLLNQMFVKNDKMSIEQLLKSKDASIASFSMYTVGEGIEKAVVDYAAEVAAAAKV
ncbi:MAG: translation elongation factor Ts, partial [Betaproteobacteria bacterium]|nr:translation elongation factor Ts [Betaproteobacteria bacterium]